MADPAFDALFSISDLHIGGDPDFRIFDDADALAAFIDAAAAHDAGRVALVINGDVFDFLAADDSVAYSPAAALTHLRQVLLPDPRLRPVFAALTRFTSARGRTLVINTGNHDVELGRPEVQAAANAALQGTGTPIAWHTHQEGYACTVAGKRVRVVHGNVTDAWNRVAPGYVDDHSDVGVGAAAPNAGSMLVTMVMNRVKRRFRWIDLLKPEGAHLAALALALDDNPQNPLLSPQEKKNLEAVLARYAKDVREGGLVSVEDAAVAVVADVEGKWRLPLLPFRLLLKHVLNARDFWSEDQRDAQWDALARVEFDPNLDVLIAGHTHAPRQGPLKGPGGMPIKTRYLNTATWAFVMTLSDADFSEESFPAIEALLRTEGHAGFEALRRASRLTPPRCYAFVDEKNHELRTFRP